MEIEYQSNGLNKFLVLNRMFFCVISTKDSFFHFYVFIKGKKPLVDLERDESSKEWLRENQERLTVPLDFNKQSAKDFSGFSFDL